jgi:hypothetical protein
MYRPSGSSITIFHHYFSSPFFHHFFLRKASVRKIPTSPDPDAKRRIRSASSSGTAGLPLNRRFAPAAISEG